MCKYHFMSKVTGEIVHNFSDVLKCLVERDQYGKLFFNLRWRYSRRGF